MYPPKIPQTQVTPQATTSSPPTASTPAPIPKTEPHKPPRLNRYVRPRSRPSPSTPFLSLLLLLLIVLLVFLLTYLIHLHPSSWFIIPFVLAFAFIPLLYYLQFVEDTSYVQTVKEGGG